MKVPEGWKKMFLGDLISLQRGYDLPTQDRIKGEIPIVGGGGYNGYHSQAKVNGPGIVLGRSGAGFGTAFYVKENFWPLNTGLFVTDFKGNDPLYIFHFLDALDFSSYNSGGAQPSLNRNFIYPILITSPPYPEQKAIADLLSTWDEAIEKTERLIQAKKASLKGQIQKLISQRCDSWPHIKPKKIFDTITEKNFPDEELLSVTQDRGVIPRSMLEGRVMSPDGTTAGYKLIKRGDFAISLRSFQGGIEYSNYQGIISPAYTVLRPKIELNSDFYRLFFKSYIFIEKYLNLAVIGIRDGKQISIPDFLSIKIPIPPLKEQKEIAETLSICQHEIDLLKQLAEKYKTQKRGLMQKMLAGEWRVKPEIVNQYMEA